MFDRWCAGIRMATPLILMACGGTWTLQTGILNISQEGGMLLGAFAAAVGSHYFSSWIAGLLCAIGAAVAFNLLFAFFAVNLRANIWVVGMTLNILASSLSVLILKIAFQTKGSFNSPRIQRIPDLFDGFSLVVWGAFVIAGIFLWMDKKSVLGLRLKATGENELAVASAGINVKALRYGVLILNGVLVGIAGAFLSISNLALFNQGMSGGRGWMAVAAVIFGDGKLVPTLVSALAFGFTMAIGNTLQTYGVNSQFALMLPYLAILAALTWKAIVKKLPSRV